MDLNRTHTNLDAADEERGTKSDIENHPRSLVTIQPGRSTKPISPSLTDREEFRSTSITDTMVDGGKTKLRSSKRPTRDQRASNLLGDAVPSCDSCALGAHIDEKATSVTESQHDPRSHSRSTKARLHGCPVDNGGPENTQRPTKLVKLKGINLAVIDKLSPSAQTDIGQSLRVPDRAPGTGSCQGYGYPPKTIAGKDEVSTGLFMGKLRNLYSRRADLSVSTSSVRKISHQGRHSRRPQHLLNHWPFLAMGSHIP